MTTISKKDQFRQSVEDGGEQVVLEYFKRLAEPGVGVDDLRKAVEFVAKVHGLNQQEKTDSLMTVSWTINGGNVTIGVEKPQAPTAELVEDVTPKDSTAAIEGSPEEPPVPATPSFTLPSVENLLEL